MDDNHSPSLTNSPSGRKRSHDEIDLPNGNDIPQSSLADYNQSPSPDLAEERPAQNMASANNSMPPPPRPTQQAPSQAAHTLPASSIPVLSSDTLPEHSTGPLSSYIPQAKRNQISANARAAQWAAEREQQEQASRASPPKEATPETESQHDEEEETQEYWPESPSDVGLPEERMEEFDWADLQQRYGSMLDAAYRKEQELSQEFSHLVDVLLLRSSSQSSTC